MTLDDLLAELRADHGIDVPALQERAALVDGAVALTTAITESLGDSGLVALSNADGEELDTDTLIGAVKEAGEKLVTLSNEVRELKDANTRKEAEDHVDSLIRSGHILPKNRKGQVELLLSNPTLFDELLPDTPLVKLSQEEGYDSADTPTTAVLSEVERIAASDAASQYVKH